MATTPTTTVDIVIRLQVAGAPSEVATHLEPLYNLGDVMVAQAEDGLWSLGAPDLETDSGPSAYIADIRSARVQVVHIGGQTSTGGRS